MSSEAQRAARALVERRVEKFASRHGLAESQSRLAAALERARPEGRVLLETQWGEESGRAALQATFAPPPRVGRFLKILSASISLMVAATIWTLASPDASPTASWLVTLFTVFSVLAMPWIFVAMGSSRLAEEARILRAIRAALVDEEE